LGFGFFVRFITCGIQVRQDFAQILVVLTVIRREGNDFQAFGDEAGKVSDVVGSEKVGGAVRVIDKGHGREVLEVETNAVHDADDQTGSEILRAAMLAKSFGGEVVQEAEKETQEGCQDLCFEEVDGVHDYLIKRFRSFAS
jgi:hypothetical protein